MLKYLKDSIDAHFDLADHMLVVLVGFTFFFCLVAFLAALAISLVIHAHDAVFFFLWAWLTLRLPTWAARAQNYLTEQKYKG